MDPKVSFITLRVEDLDAATRYYTDTLGWSPLLLVPGEVSGDPGLLVARDEEQPVPVLVDTYPVAGVASEALEVPEVHLAVQRLERFFLLFGNRIPGIVGKRRRPHVVDLPLFLAGFIRAL
ncbi:MAG: VOC family protein [Actinomycetota bacterium]